MARTQPKIIVNKLNEPSQKALREFKRYVIDLYCKYSD